MRIEKHTKGVVTGADVQTDDSVEVINKHHVIATLTDDVPFVIEMVVENGRGYVPATEHSPNVQEIGIIPIDAVYSPVVRVRYEIEETRVGQKTNYDKLTLEIWTNGSIHPEMALVESAKILRKHLNPFVQYSELGSRVHAAGRGGMGTGTDAAIESKLNMSLAELNLRCGPPTAWNRKTSTPSATWCAATKTNCSKSATSARPRSTKSRRSSPSWASGWACECRPRPAFEQPMPEPATAGSPTSISRRSKSPRHATSTKRPHARPLAQPSAGLVAEPGQRLFLTERDAEDDDNKPKVKGRIITTCKRPRKCGRWSSRCITIARNALPAQREADKFGTTAERNSDAWKTWRKSDQWQKWNQAIAPLVAARRRALRLLGDKQAVRILFAEVAPRFTDRPGGYTRDLRLAKPRLGDAGTRAILEFVGVRDRVTQRARSRRSNAARRRRVLRAGSEKLARRCGVGPVPLFSGAGGLSATQEGIALEPLAILAKSRTAAEAARPATLRTVSMPSRRQRRLRLHAAHPPSGARCHGRLPELAHVDLARVAIRFCQARKAVPLRHAGQPDAAAIREWFADHASAAGAPGRSSAFTTTRAARCCTC